MPIRLAKTDSGLLDLLASGHSEREVCVRMGVTESKLDELWRRVTEKFQSSVPRSEEEYALFHTFEKIERRRLEAELWASEARLNALMDTAPEAILVVNGRSGRILQANNQAILLFGYPPRELVGKPVEILIDPELSKKHVSLRNGFLNSVRKRELGLHPPIEAWRRDGTKFMLEIALTATAATDDVMVVCRPAQSQASATAQMSMNDDDRANIA